jgi:hypothetical protein
VLQVLQEKGFEIGWLGGTIFAKPRPPCSAWIAQRIQGASDLFPHDILGLGL